MPVLSLSHQPLLKGTLPTVLSVSGHPCHRPNVLQSPVIILARASEAVGSCPGLLEGTSRAYHGPCHLSQSPGESYRKARMWPLIQ